MLVIREKMTGRAGGRSRAVVVASMEHFSIWGGPRIHGRRVKHWMIVAPPAPLACTDAYLRPVVKDIWTVKGVRGETFVAVVFDHHFWASRI